MWGMSVKPELIRGVLVKFGGFGGSHFDQEQTRESSKASRDEGGGGGGGGTKVARFNLLSSSDVS